MLFSATLDNDVDVLVRRFLSDPAQHAVDSGTLPGRDRAPRAHRRRGGPRRASWPRWPAAQGRTLVFTRTKHAARSSPASWPRAGIPAAELHGNLAQGARERNLAAFAAGDVRVLVATDIAARGIHIDGIDLVIHADPPAEHKAYVHRSGRTARAGAGGVVVTLQTTAQAADVAAMMRRASVIPLRATVRPGSELLRSIAGPPADRTAPAARAAAGGHDGPG